MQQRVAEAGEWLHKQEPVESVFIEFGNPLLQLRHACRKWRQIREGMSPDKAQHDNDPRQDSD
jgi:hypothetical protein